MKIAQTIFALILVLFTSCAHEKIVDNNIDDANVLDGISVNDLIQMNLGEAIDLLEKNKPGAFYTVSAYDISYEGSCRIRFRDTVEINEDGEIKLEIDETDLQTKIIAVTIFQEANVYKGISVGKTLDEINSNPDLLNPLEATVDEMDNRLYAVGFYDYKDTLMGISLIFNVDMVCVEIDLSTTEELRGESWIKDCLL